MIKYTVLPLMFVLSACTYSINLVHTEGMASDVVDENQSPSARVVVPPFKPSVSIPRALVVR